MFFISAGNLCAQEIANKEQLLKLRGTKRVYSIMSVEKAEEIIKNNLERFPEPWQLPNRKDKSLMVQGINIDNNDWVVLASIEIPSFNDYIYTDGLPEDARPEPFTANLKRGPWVFRLITVPLGIFASTIDLTVTDNECFTREGQKWIPATKLIKKGYYIFEGWQNGIILSKGHASELFIILSKNRYKTLKESPFLRRVVESEDHKDYALPPLISSSDRGIEIKFNGATSFYLK